MPYESQESEYVLLIGRGLSAFGSLEMALGQLFTMAIDAANPKAAERVFWSVNSLEVRTAMTSAALKEVFRRLPDGSELQAEWAEIASSIPKHASKRNEMAHGNWVGVAWATRKGLKEDQFFAPYYGKNSIDVEPHNFDPRYDPRPKKRLYKPDLEATIRGFGSLHMAIRSLTNRLSWQMRQQASDPREPEA